MPQSFICAQTDFSSRGKERKREVLVPKKKENFRKNKQRKAAENAADQSPAHFQGGSVKERRIRPLCGHSFEPVMMLE